MIRRHMFALRLLLLGVDLASSMAVFWILGNLRFGDASWTTMWESWGIDTREGAAFYAVTWAVTLWFLGLYALRTRWSAQAEINDISVAAFLMAGETMSFLYIVKVDISRLFLLALLVVQPMVTFATRSLMRQVFSRLRTSGYNRAYMVVIGTGEEAQEFAGAIERHQELGIEVIGHLRAPDDAEPLVTRTLLGEVADLARIFHERVVDEVAICVAPGDMAWAEPYIRLAADEGKHVRIPARPEAITLDRSTEELDGLLVRSYVHGPARLLSLATKRGIDIVGALVGLVILSPVVAVVSIVIILTDGRPVYYHQTRIGLHGRPFTLHKFRSMVRDADARFSEVQHLNERAEITFKAEADPRITRIGRILRKTSIDELPQLWNVLWGQMSLVGPRPPLEREVVAYDIWHRRRLSMKPGITGLWQVESRTDPSFDHWVDRDLEYIDRWCLELDVKILLKTIPAVAGRTGS